jgi:Outer membrane protein beta-barrel domain
MRSLFLFLVAMLTAGLLQAQMTIKPTAGLNFTDWSEDPISAEFKAKVGGQIGGSMMFGKKFYIEPGIFWVGKSTELSSTSSTVDDFKYTLSGVRVPVAVGLNLLGNSKSVISLRGFGGFSGFFVTGTGDDIDKDDINTAQWGVFAGAGLDFWIMFIDASYEWSLTDVQKDISNINLGQTRTIYLNTGFRIKL